MNEIMTDYLINPRTRILLPAKEIEYDTIIYEQDKQIFVKKTAMQLIETACLRYGSTYDGRRRATVNRTNFKRMVPIPISISRDIYAFPTHSPTDYDCAWIFSNHVQAYKRIPPTKHASEKSMIIFNDNLELSLDVSTHTIKKQKERAELCKFLFTDGVQY